MAARPKRGKMEGFQRINMIGVHGEAPAFRESEDSRRKKLAEEGMFSMRWLMLKTGGGGC
jgi:hypothetical protein